MPFRGCWGSGYRSTGVYSSIGALISPTDPVSVLDVLKRAGVPQHRQATVAGESLFNDGIGVVLFTLMLSLATSRRIDDFVPAQSPACFCWRQSAGFSDSGSAISRVDDYDVELIISLALASGTYSMAGLLGVSGPIAVVVAGILIGNHGMNHAMSETPTPEGGGTSRLPVALHCVRLLRSARHNLMPPL